MFLFSLFYITGTFLHLKKMIDHIAILFMACCNKKICLFFHICFGTNNWIFFFFIEKKIYMESYEKKLVRFVYYIVMIAVLFFSYKKFLFIFSCLRSTNLHSTILIKTGHEYIIFIRIRPRCRFTIPFGFDF